MQLQSGEGCRLNVQLPAKGAHVYEGRSQLRAMHLALRPSSLEARPMVAQALLGSRRTWDVHYNISPQEPDGHFLLVPEITLPHNRRAQRLLAQDCEDLV